MSEHAQLYKVMAKKLGFYGGSIRAENVTFTLDDLNDFEPGWMIPVNFMPGGAKGKRGKTAALAAPKRGAKTGA